MNGKQAKRLRRIAADATVGKPTRHLVVALAAANPAKPDGRREFAVNDPATLRGMYRKLKRLFRAGSLR